MENDKLFHIRLQFQCNIQWPTCSGNENNWHSKDLDILDKTIQNFLTATNAKLYKGTMRLNNYHLVIKI